MVSDSRTPTRDARTEDRAQLILIAAIALAFIILSIVVVFNSVLYTQTMSSSSSIETTSDAQMAELEMARGVRGIAQDVNLDSSTDDIVGRSEAFSGQYQKATAERRPAIVDISDIATNESATAINPGDLNDNIESSNSWNSGREIGHFAIVFEPDSLDEEISVSVTNESDSESLRISRDGDDLQVDGEHCPVEYEESNSVIFDFVSGTVIGDNISECSAKLIKPQDSYQSFTIEIEDVDHGIGHYELVAQGTDPIDGSGNEYPAAWTVDLEYTYDTSELSVDRQFEVDVYGDRR